jgi:hypothetical protein
MDHQATPDELKQPIPRLVKTSGAFKWMTILMTISFPGMGLFILLMTYNISHDEDILKRTGVAAEAQVTNLNIEHGKGSRIYYKVSYRFIDNNNQKISGFNTQQTSEENYDNLKLGQEVPILYDPAHPSRSDLNFNDRIHTSNPYQLMPFMIKLTVILFGGCYAFIMFFMAFPYLKQKNLVRTGVAVPALILKEEPGYKGTNTVTYGFKTLQGEKLEGIQKNIPPITTNSGKRFLDYRVKKLDNPIVLYDPQKPSTNILYPADYVKCCLPS